MKKLIIAAALIALPACEREATPAATNAATSTATAQPAGAEAASGPAAAIGEWGVETADMLPEIAPGEDFYRHVNGGWLDTFEIPDEYSSYGSFTILFERAEARIRDIVEDASEGEIPGAQAKRIGDFFNAYTDVDAINAKGLDPVADDLAAIAALESHEDVARAMAAPGFPASPIRAFVSVDARAPDRYIVYLTQSGLGMPNRNYYREEKFADKSAKYKAYIEKILALAGADDAAARAQAIYDVEKKLADAHWSPEKRRERDLTYNLKSRAELEAFAPAVPWEAYFEASGLSGETKFVVREDDAIARTAEIFAGTPVETWRDYLAFHLLNDYADVLPEEFDAANFDFMQRELRGALKRKERWKRGVAAVNGALGEAVGEIYVARHFSENAKSEMDALVADLRAAFAERLDGLAWMSDETKAEARAKLEKFVAKIGYPEKWRDYSGLDVDPADAYGNAKRSAAFEWQYSISRLGKPVDRTEWGMTPQTVNAYYSAQRNEIVFPAAILDAPFFDPNADPAVNYGAIGAVIGHEIGHGFDDQGRKSDGDGMLRDWWTSDDADAFSALASKLGAQYAEYEPIDGFKVNPDLTMGENIGDLGGLSLAYHAYRLSLGGEEAPIIDGYTGDQRFFMAWAQVWKRLVRDDQLKTQVATDPHAPAQYRVNGVVRNMDPWYAAFAIGPDDALYLPPEERVSIW